MEKYLPIINRIPGDKIILTGSLAVDYYSTIHNIKKLSPNDIDLFVIGDKTSLEEKMNEFAENNGFRYKGLSFWIKNKKVIDITFVDPNKAKKNERTNRSPPIFCENLGVFVENPNRLLKIYEMNKDTKERISKKEADLLKIEILSKLIKFYPPKGGTKRKKGRMLDFEEEETETKKPSFLESLNSNE
jgi:hypothetical protein